MAFDRKEWLSSKVAVALGADLAASMLAVPAHSTPAPVLFHETWIDGTTSAEPETQVQALDADTFVIRQSIKTNFEAPFLYLLFGKNRALLFDTGAQNGVIRPTIDRIVNEWLTSHHKGKLPLIVAHSHSHGDHIAADASFRERSDTTVIGLAPTDVAAFFGMQTWPNDVVSFDLGGRVLNIIPTPEHQLAHIMIYDPKVEILLSGDALYPGRLYVPVNHMDEARASIDRLAAFAARHSIRAVLGAHIEMTRTPGLDYVQNAPEHPNEHRLELPPESIEMLQKAFKAPLEKEWHAQPSNDFILYPVPPRSQ
jgi:glyoxylase-like metal-dependent hydrolase (beta-lactamase superfamily II)